MIKNEQVAIWVRKTWELLDEALEAEKDIGAEHSEEVWGALYAIPFIDRVDQMPNGVPTQEGRELRAWRDRFMLQVNYPHPPARLEAMARENGFTEYLVEHGREKYGRPQPDEFYSGRRPFNE